MRARSCILLAVAGFACGSTPASTPRPGPPATPRPLAGTYVVPQSYVEECGGDSDVSCEALEEEPGSENRLTIVEVDADTIEVTLQTVGVRLEICELEGSFRRVAGAGAEARYQYVAGDTEEPCAVQLVASDTQIAITADRCQEYCGTRATLDSTFPRP